MSKPKDIAKHIAKEAERQHLSFVREREGANHTVYNLDGIMIPIPRHREIGKGLTEQIYRECQPKLGKGWWRR